MTPTRLGELAANRAGASPELARASRLAGRLLRQGVAAASAVRADFVPGRIELLGKHTDYAGGRSLLTATEQGLVMVSVPRRDAILRAVDDRRDESVELAITAEPDAAHGHWSLYPRTVARRLAANFPGPLQGADIAFESDLPPAAGLSSSTVLVVAFYRALAAANRLEQRPELRAAVASAEDLAAYLAAVESGAPYGPLGGDDGVGVLGGSEDHTAILCARSGHAVRYRYRPTRGEGVVAIPPGFRFAVAFSGVRAAKAGAVRDQYNRAARRAAAVAELWRRSSGDGDAHLGAIAARGPQIVDRLRRTLATEVHPEFSPRELRERCEQFLEESEELVPAAFAALTGGDLEGFGRLASRSQRLAERLLGNQLPETIDLVREAVGAGAVAASAFGAGFGGSVWALVEADAADRFCDRWSQAYRQLYPQRGDAAFFFTTSAAPAARRLTPAAPERG